MRRLTFLRVFCVFSLVFAACADEPVAGTDGSGADVGASDAVAEDSVEVDTEPMCEHGCFDETGKSKKTLCPAPISDWKCVQGCCEEVFVCKTNSDCSERGVSEGQCEDLGYDCRCDLGTGVCFDWYCGVDADCGVGQTCSAGVCVASPEVGTLELRFVSPPRVIATDEDAELKVEAFDPADGGIVVAAEVSFQSSDSTIVSIDDAGIALGGAVEGTVTITATLSAEPTQTAELTLRNVALDGTEGLVVIATRRNSTHAIAGRYALVDAGTSDTLAAGAIPDDGVIRWVGAVPSSGVDVHVFGEASDWISVLGVTSGPLLLAGTPISWAALSITKEGTVDADASDVAGMRVLSGAPDFSAYSKTGEFELSLNCFALSNALFDFNLDAILGSEVSRYFDPDTVLPGVDKTSPADMPGGITFGLGGPALPRYYLTSAPSTRLLWTLGGRVEMAEVAPIIGDIIDSVTGDAEIDFGKLISAIIPLFGSFWSGIVPELPIEAGDALSIVELNPILRVPMGLSSVLEVPALPAVGDAGWADALFLMGGAFTADGSMVPLGINAGADTIDSELSPADGWADADQKTPEIDAFNVPMAMLHSGLGGPHTRYGVAAVAAIIKGKNDPRPEGGSAILELAPVGQRLAPTLTLPEFLEFPLASTWDPETRALHVVTVAGADTQRLLFKGKTGADWTIWLRGRVDYDVPVASDFFVGEEEMLDRATSLKLALVNSFDFRDGTVLDAILAPGGDTLDGLLSVTRRVSFIDIR